MEQQFGKGGRNHGRFSWHPLPLGALPISLGRRTTMGQLASLGGQLPLGWRAALGRFSLVGQPFPLGHLPSLELGLLHGPPLAAVGTVLHDPGDVLNDAGHVRNDERKAP